MEDTPAISDEADPLYRPLGGLERWAAAPVDDGAWTAAVERWHRLRAEDPDRGDMVGRGALLGAAYQSGALDGLYPADPDVTVALVRGEASPEDLDETVRAHVTANRNALRLARDAAISEAAVRRIHELACRPQLTHRVWVGETLQDHVMAGGDYKHHPNHVRTADGGWRPTAPVALVRREMARVVDTAASADFAALHPAAQAAWLHHALLHVQPFADGNGRVARAVAGGCLLRAASIPLLLLPDDAAGPVEAVQRSVLALVDVMTEHRPSAALDRWRERAAAGRAFRAVLEPAVRRALDRYQHRADRGWGADLSAAAVTPGEPLTVRVGAVVERLAVDPHPRLVVAAEEARLRHESGEEGLDAWLDRVVSTLALRVAADLD
ncbi:MAG TPA: Fic family protein [Acidimicrobiales bacterium]|nr:Fic family protein [Acidimicrobiales bacterium]